MLGLGATVRQCPLESIVGDGDSYSLGYSVAHVRSVGLSIMEWLEGKMNPQQVGRAGELYVAAEIHRRGGYAVTFAGNMPGIDLLACDITKSRRISIQVKTRNAGSWHAHFGRDAAQCSENPAEDSFWIFVDLSPDHPEYFVAPRWWVRNNIWEVHTAYLARWEREHGHPRESQHHGIRIDRIERCGVIGISWASSNDSQAFHAAYTSLVLVKKARIDSHVLLYPLPYVNAEAELLEQVA